jgi:hypothetical protein
MAQLSDDTILQKIIHGEVKACDGLLELIDRSKGTLTAGEAQLLDFKEKFHPNRAEAVAELARDVLGFSNADGGVLLLGVTDDLSVIGHERLDPRAVINSLGPYIGTRVDYDIGEITPNIAGAFKIVPFVLVRRSVAAYPTLLRKDIELRSGLVRKVKYCAGSLFYRHGNQTLVEPVGGDIDGKARDLRFSGAAPRTRSSFLLEEDKPGLRLYAHINDRFFGRDSELAELFAKFDDPRGKGVSLAGLGGVGKTELAIKIVSELFKRGKFHSIYSGSAKQSLLGPVGPQQADPAFSDFPSFLRDLSAWLGLNVTPGVAPDRIAAECLSELSKAKKVLLFVDNLETIEDRRLFDFLDNKLPNNCWIMTTGRVHKVRVNLYPREIREMEPLDAARLLRHELKRQGLEDLAASRLDELKDVAGRLYCHPLAIRWFAWACKRDAGTWTRGPQGVRQDELESFCVAHTLSNLPAPAQKVLGAMVAVKDQAEASVQCLFQTSRVTGAVLDQALFELESAGLLSARVNDETGLVTYLIAPLAEVPARELARTRGWEGEYTANLNRYIARVAVSIPDDPLIRDLVEFDPRSLRGMSREDIGQLEARLDRALPRASGQHSIYLGGLKGECERQLGNPVSADELYQKCADEVLKSPARENDSRFARILLEAATVAKARSHSEPQIRRAITYLEAIQRTSFAPLRVLGMLTEFYAMVNDRGGYEKYWRRVTNLRDSNPGRFSESQLAALEEALHRASDYFLPTKPAVS